MHDDLAHVHCSATTGINRQNVGKLQQVWAMQTEGAVSAAPLVADGRVYIADWGGTVYGGDARSGAQLWKRKVEQPETSWYWHGICGSGALGDGLLFFASAEGNAFALRPDDGTPQWQLRVTDQRYAGSISDLLYYDGLIYVGLSSVEEGQVIINPQYQPVFRGQVVALDAKSGTVAWRCELVQSPGNGCAMWSSFALDPETSTLFFDTGNNYTGSPTEHSDAMIAVDCRSGKIKWSTQVYEDDVWDPVNDEGPDYDFAAGPQLFEATIDGQRRKLVGAGDKGGLYWAFDRGSGELVWKTVISYGGNLGGVHAEASIADDTLYLYGNNHYQKAQASTTPEEAAMNVVALDAATGHRKWWRSRVQPAEVWSAGFLSQDVYFVGSQAGMLGAYAAADGSTLWTTHDVGIVNSSLLVVGDTLFVGTQAQGHAANAKVGQAKGASSGGINGLVAFRPS